MLDLFNEFTAKAKGRVQDPSFIYIHSAVNKNISRIRERVLNSSMALPPDHLLVKLIYSLGIRRSMDDMDVIFSVTDKTYDISSAMNLTSTTSYGQSFQGQFFKAGTETILLTTEDFDLDADWKELSPIKFLYHTHTNANFQIGGRDDDMAFAVVSINLPMLAYQYVSWSKWARAQEQPDNLYQFLVKYPMFNSLKTYMDISLFNRHYYRVIGRPIEPDPKVREYPVPDIEDRLDNSNVTIVNLLMNKPHTLGQSLYQTPAFFEDSALDLIPSPDVIATSQNRWLLLLHRLPYLHYGLTLSLVTGSNLDRGAKATLLRELKAFNNSRGLERLPATLKKDIQARYIDPVFDIAKML